MSPKSGVRPPAVAGHFYPEQADELRRMVDEFLDEAGAAEPVVARGAIVPHAGLVFSGACAAHVFARLTIPPVVVILAPNHTGFWENAGGAGAWDHGAMQTPLGTIPIAEDFLHRLESVCALVAHDPAAHRMEHAVEVELPFLSTLAADSSLAPIVLAWDDWDHCKTLADGLVRVVREWPTGVLLVASSDMTHYESAESAARKDRLALAAVEQLDGEQLLATCRRENVTMCGRAPAAVVLEATRQLGATRTELVDYRHSGWVTGDDRSVVAYAGVLIN